MSPQEIQAMCESKIRYVDKRDVQTFINRAHRLRGRRGRALALRPYPCPICNGWHVTKKT